MEIDSSSSIADNIDKLSRESLRNDMLDYLCKSKEAHFKSQQRGEPELLESEKRSIAESILNGNSGTFLSRFGNYLQDEHLEYFTVCSESERYEVDFYLKRIRATRNKCISKVKVRNRRFEALKKLVSEGSYFSEYEMKKRNPLLYEQLIGQFLTEDEEMERTGIDTTNITFVNLLLEQYDRDQMTKLKAKQKEDEDNLRDTDECSGNDCDMLNVDSSSDPNKREVESKNGTIQDDDDDDDDEDFEEKHISKSLWGEAMTDKIEACPITSSSKEAFYKKDIEIKTRIYKKFHKHDDDDDVEEEEEEEEDEEDIAEDEKQLFVDEFRSSMFNNFLEGKDNDFDYNEVDRNSEYDDLDMRDLDEQQQYFDSETPEEYQSMVTSDNSNQGMNTATITPITDNTNCENIKRIDSNNVTSDSDCNQNSEDKFIDNYVTTLQDQENAEKISAKMKNLHH